MATLRNFCWAAGPQKCLLGSLPKPGSLGQNVPKRLAASPPLSRWFLIRLLAFMEQIERRTYKHTTPPAERARNPLIQVGFKCLNANSPAVEKSGFTARSTLSPCPFPIMGKGAALEDISPAAPGKVHSRGGPSRASRRKRRCYAPLTAHSRMCSIVGGDGGYTTRAPMQKCAGTTIALGHFVSKSLRDNLDFAGGMAGVCWGPP